MPHEVNANSMFLKARINPIYLILFVLFTATEPLAGQCDQTTGSLIVNEVWNDYITEFIELVVVGDPANPTAPVNLEGWIIDDNHAIGAGVGSQPGHIKLGNCFSAVEPGTIILLYNENYQLPTIDPSNDGTPNAAGVYQLSGTDPCLIKFRSCPTPRSRTYGCDADPQLNNSPAAWARTIPLANTGDVVQVRDPQERLVHALYWIIQDFPGADDPFSVYIDDDESASGHSYQFTGSTNWYDPSQYSISTQNSPGEANSTDNANFISALASGQGLEELNLSCEMLTPTNGDLNNGSIQLTVGGGFPPYSITVNEEEVTNLSAAGPYVLDNLAAGYYRIEVRDDNACMVDCELVVTDQTSESLNVCDMPGTMIGMNTDDCFIWQPTEGLEDPSSSMTLATPIETTVYTLIRMDDNGNVLGETAYTVESHAIGVTIYPEEATVCLATETYLEALTWVPVDQYSISWSTGETEQVIAVTDPGTYSVTLTHNETGCEESATVEVLSSFEGVRITASANAVCKGKPVQLLAESSAGNDGPFEFEWSTGENKADIEIEEAGIYSVTITNVTTACTAETEIDIKSDDITVVIEPSTPILCPSDDLTLQIDGTYAEIKWYDLNDPATVIGQATEQAVLSAGQYEVQVIGNTGCQATAQTEVFDAISEVTAIKQFFEEKGFYAMPIEVLGPITLRSSDQEKSLNTNRICDCASSGSCTDMVMDDARLQIAIDGITLQDIKVAVEDNLNYFQSEFGYTDTKAIITGNDELCDCDDYLAKADNLFQSMDLGYWIHLYDDPNSEQDWLYILANVPSQDQHYPADANTVSILNTSLQDIFDNDRTGNLNTTAELATFVLQDQLLDNFAGASPISSNDPDVLLNTDPCERYNGENKLVLSPSGVPIQLPDQSILQFYTASQFDEELPNGALTGFTDITSPTNYKYYKARLSATAPYSFEGYYQTTIRGTYVEPGNENPYSSPTPSFQDVVIGKSYFTEEAGNYYEVTLHPYTCSLPSYPTTGEGAIVTTQELETCIGAQIDVGTSYGIDLPDISLAAFEDASPNAIYNWHSGVLVKIPREGGYEDIIYGALNITTIEPFDFTFFRWNCSAGDWEPFPSNSSTPGLPTSSQVAAAFIRGQTINGSLATPVGEADCIELSSSDIGAFTVLSQSNTPVNSSNPNIIEYAILDATSRNQITKAVEIAASRWSLGMKVIVSADAPPMQESEFPQGGEDNAYEQFYGLDMAASQTDVMLWTHYHTDGTAQICIRYKDGFYQPDGLINGIDDKNETKQVLRDALESAKSLTLESLQPNAPYVDPEYPASVNDEGVWNWGVRPGYESEVNLYGIFKEVLGISRQAIKDLAIPKVIWQPTDKWATNQSCMWDTPGVVFGPVDAFAENNPYVATAQLVSFGSSIVKDKEVRQALGQACSDIGGVARGIVQDLYRDLSGEEGPETQMYQMGKQGTGLIFAILNGRELINYIENLSSQAKDAAESLRKQLKDFPTSLTDNFYKEFEGVSQVVQEKFMEFLGKIGNVKMKIFISKPELVRVWKYFDESADIANIFKKFPDASKTRFYDEFVEVFIDAQGQVKEIVEQFFADIGRNDNLLRRFGDDLSVKAWDIIKDLPPAIKLKVENLQTLTRYLEVENVDISKLKSSLLNARNPEKWIELKIPRIDLDVIYAGFRNDPPFKHTSWTPEHKAQRWKNYEEGCANGQNACLDFESWSNNYDGKIDLVTSTNRGVDDYFISLGWDCPASTCRERTLSLEVDGETVNRRLDIYDEANARGKEFKEYSSGKVYRSEDIRSEVIRDKQLMEDGMLVEMEWVFKGCEPSGPLKTLLESGPNPITIVLIP